MRKCPKRLGWSGGTIDPTPARADPRAQPALDVVDAGLPGQRARRDHLLQRGRGHRARAPLRGERPDVAAGLGQHLRAVRRRRAPDPVRGAAADGRAAARPPRALPSSDPLSERQRAPGRGQRHPGHRRRRLPGRDGALLGHRRGRLLKLTIWGARGSIPAPGPETTHYGGNTSCVQVTLDDGTTFVLDAGTGIRSLGLALDGAGEQPLNILLTHLHLDHIQGLMFFAPMFNPRSEIIVWGPASPEASLEDRVARYISAPLTPVDVRELPCHPSFREAETTEWRIGPAVVRAASVTHRGPTLGYRIEADGSSLCYIPDHEPGLGAPLASLEEDWISGFDLARGASLLIHDCQYTDEEYPHHIGWGHSPVADTLEFAKRTEVERVMMFHHDPLHSDAFLDQFASDVGTRIDGFGRRAEWAFFATERQQVEVTSMNTAA